VRAHARIVAMADAHHNCRLTELHSEAPIALRQSSGAVYLVSSAQGLLGVDDLHLDIVIGPSARLEVRTTAATIAYASEGARLSVTAEIASGGRLVWRPEPLIVTRRSSVITDSTVSLAGDAALDWNETCLLGRNPDDVGALSARTTVDRRGRPLLRHHVQVGDIRGWNGPAILDTARALALRLVVDAELSAATRHGTGYAVMALCEDVELTSALAPDLSELERRMARSRDVPDGMTVRTAAALAFGRQPRPPEQLLGERGPHDRIVAGHETKSSFLRDRL